MLDLSDIIIKLSSLEMFSSIESVNSSSQNPKEIGEIKVNFQGETIKVSVMENDDEFSISEKIIKKSSLR